MAVEHSGSTKKYADNWAQAFGAGARSVSAGKKTGTKKAAPQQSPKGGSSAGTRSRNSNRK